MSNNDTALQTADRAEQVKQQLLQLKDKVEDSFFDLCDLLLEAKEGSYHNVWGYGQFGDWVEMASGLDMSRRQADYYVSIGRKSKVLGLTRDQLKQAKISKLKEVFSLDTQTQGEQMKQLVEEAKTESLEAIREKVQGLKAKDGEEPWVYMTIKVPKSVKEDSIEPALELARRIYGNQFREDGEVYDITDSKCWELICVTFNQDPNNQHEAQLQTIPSEA